MNIPGADKPLQPLEVWYAGGYAQDEWRPAHEPDRHRRPAVRRPVRSATRGSPTRTPTPDVPRRERTGRSVTRRASCRTRRSSGRRASASTGTCSGDAAHAGPRRHRRLHRPAGLCLDLEPDRQHRRADRLRCRSTTRHTRPFHPDPNRYKPTTPPTGAPAASYELALTDPDFKFPQIWRSNIAVDQRLPVEHHGNRRVPLQQGRQRHLLHQRQPAGRADDVRRRRQPAALDEQPHSLAHLECHRAEEPGRGLIVEFRRHRCRSEPRLDCRSKAPTATAGQRTPWTRGASRSAPGQATPTRAIRTIQVSSLLELGPPRLRARVLHPRVLQIRGNVDLGVSGRGATTEHSSYVFAGDMNRRRRVQQRPDLHPARHLGDELLDVHRQWAHVHRRRAGAGV